MSTPADFAARLQELQADFRRIADRDPWVGARVAVRPGELGAFGLGRPGPGRYLIRLCCSPWAMTLRGLPGPDDDEESFQNENPPVYSELETLTARAGALLEEMCQAGRYEIRPTPRDTVPYAIAPPPVQDPDVHFAVSVLRWLAFLLHAHGTLGHCLVKVPDGMVAACFHLRDGETTVACIDQYAGVCLVGLARLKAGATETPFTRLKALADDPRLGKNEARIIKMICDGSGQVALTDLGLELDWVTPSDNWNSARKRLNGKLKGHGWVLITRRGHAVARELPQAGRK
jgi:hypothetical protein